MFAYGKHTRSIKATSAEYSMQKNISKCTYFSLTNYSKYKFFSQTVFKMSIAIHKHLNYIHSGFNLYWNIYWKLL